MSALPVRRVLRPKPSLPMTESRSARRHFPLTSPSSHRRHRPVFQLLRRLPNRHSVVIAQRKTWNNSLKIRRQRTLKRITLMAAVSKSHRAEIIHQHPTLQPSSTCEGHYNTYSGDKAEKSRTVFTQS